MISLVSECVSGHNELVHVYNIHCICAGISLQ